MQQWEYCEVAWTPKQVMIHVYSSRDNGMYEGIQPPEEWGALLTQLGADGWELVGVVPARPATHTLYYFKRAVEFPAEIEWQERQKAIMQQGKLRQQEMDQKKVSSQPASKETRPEAG